MICTIGEPHLRFDSSLMFSNLRLVVSTTKLVAKGESLIEIQDRADLPQALSSLHLFGQNVLECENYMSANIIVVEVCQSAL